MKKTIQQDHMSCFSLERLAGGIYYLQMQGCLKIYGAVKGEASVTVSGENRLLAEGQMAIVDRYEPHSCQLHGNAEIVVANIGANYTRSIFSLFPKKRMVRWLMDDGFNRRIFSELDNIFDQSQMQIPELKKIGCICNLFSEVIEHYGLEDRVEISETDLDLTANVIQHIYEHCSEKITLESLAKVFHLSPTALSKKLGKHLGVDLRVFVNDVRVQKAMQMMENPAYKGKAINEIAFMCGFNSMTTFYRSYRRNLGAIDRRIFKF